MLSNIQDMKLITLLLMLPLFSLATPNFDLNKNSLHPANLKYGIDVSSVNKFLTKKSKKFSNEITFHYLKSDFIKLDNIKIKDAFVVADNGTIKSYSLELDKENGATLLSDVVKQYGMPVDDVIDVLEWKLGSFVFEIHETESGYLATYKPLTELSVASVN